MKWWLLIALTIISTGTALAFQDQSHRYQQRIQQTTTQLEQQKAAERQKMQQQLNELKKTNGDQQKTIDDLNTQLQAKRSVQATLASATRAAVSYVAPVAYASGGSDAKSFIYAHESGNNPGAINAGSGACGLGQALPCSKMPCGLADYGCQDNFFTQYMLSRYGTWEAARAFWLAHSWW